MTEVRQHAQQLSAVDVTVAVLKNARLVIAVAVLGAILAATSVFLRGGEYTAEATFAPSRGRSASPSSTMAGLAAQFGISGLVSSEAESVQFYAELLRSEDVLAGAGTTRYTVPGRRPGDPALEGDLVDLFDIEVESDVERRRKAARQAGRMVRIETNLQAGVVDIAVTAPWPSISEDLAARVLALVNEFNLDRRQSQARAERHFVETRMNEAARAMEQAEDEVLAFRQNNRGPSITQSPQLSAELDRLTRIVDLRRQVYVSLVQSYEQARIDEVRDTPVITLIDAPQGSARPTGPSMIFFGILGLFLGAIAAVGALLLAQYGSLLRAQRPADFRDIEAAVAGFRIPHVMRNRGARKAEQAEKLSHSRSA